MHFGYWFKGDGWYWNDLVMIIFFPLCTGSTRSQLNDLNKTRMLHAKPRLQSTNALKEIAIESSAKSEIWHWYVVILTVVYRRNALSPELSNREEIDAQNYNTLCACIFERLPSRYRREFLDQIKQLNKQRVEGTCLLI